MQNSILLYYVQYAVKCNTKLTVSPSILGNITGTYYNFNLCIGKSHVQIINRRQQFSFYTQYTILTLFVEPHNLIWTIYCYKEN